MKNSPLQLERIFLTAVHLDAKPEAKAPPGIDWRVSSDVTVASHATDPLRWKVGLTVNLTCVDAANAPYNGSVSFTGLFAVADSYPKDKVRFLVETNGPSVLYGAAREMFANLTARGPWPMVQLPTQSFYKPQDAKPAPQEPKQGEPQPPANG
jgi:preprotein translocase subunit SecB